MTPKQEKFARLYIETGNANEAYRQAYNTQNMQPASINTEAHKLLSHTKISQKINELRQELAMQYDLNIDVLMHELEQARQMALENNQPKVAIEATLGKAKLAGLISETKQAYDFPTVIEIVGPNTKRKDDA